MKISVKNEQGQVQEVELPGTPDWKAIGVLSPQEVDALKARAIEDGKRIGLTEAEKYRAELEAIKAEKEALGKGKHDADSRLGTLEKTIATLTASLEGERKAREEAAFRAHVGDTLSGVPVVRGAAEIFADMARKSLKEGGFQLADGTLGTMQQFRDEFFGSELGKRLVLTTQKGGAGTGGDASLDGKSFADILKSPEAASKFIEKNGREAFGKAVFELHQPKKT
jgi:hypothetical protein